MDKPGGSWLKDIREKIIGEIREYYGLLNELKAGVTTKIPEKPVCLATHELYNAMNIPLVQGGLMDQPHLWLIEWQLVHDQVKLMEAVT